MDILFAEQRLAYRGGGERPRPREVANQSTEIPQADMKKIALRFTSYIRRNATIGEQRDVKAGGLKAKKVLDKWLKEKRIIKEGEAFGGGVFGNAETPYTYNGKKINPKKLVNQLYSYLVNNQQALKAATARKKSRTEDLSMSERVTTRASNYKEVGFPGRSQEEANRNSRYAEKFYKQVVEFLLDQYSVTSPQEAANVQKKLNAKLNKYGVNVLVTHVSYKVMSRDRKGNAKYETKHRKEYKIQFNGVKAWPYISSNAKIRNHYRKLTGQAVPSAIARLPKVERTRA